MYGAFNLRKTVPECSISRRFFYLTSNHPADLVGSAGLVKTNLNPDLFENVTVQLQ